MTAFNNLGSAWQRDFTANCRRRPEEDRPLTVVAAPQLSDDFIINDSGVLTGYREAPRDVVAALTAP